jgi:OOP family OmpA-OmpF porin
VDDDGPATEVLATLRALVAELPRLLVSGRVEVLDRNGMDDAIVAVRVTGIHVDEAARARVEELLASTMAMVETEPRARADEAAVLDVQRRVAALLVDRPLVFAPGATTPEDGAVVLDLIAAALRRVEGLSVTVVGHTDSTGDPAANLALSEERAEAVRDELVARGLPASTLRVVGRGGTEPVRVDGVEDVEASRRIEFVVRLATSG